MTKHVATKRILKSNVDLIVKAMKNPFISEEDKNLLSLIYIDNQDFNFIADQLSVSEPTVKFRHKRLLDRISNLIESGNL